LAEHSVVIRITQFIDIYQTSNQFTTISSKRRSREKNLPRWRKFLQQTLPASGCCVVRFVYKNDIEEIDRWACYAGEFRTYAVRCTHHDVVWAKVRPFLGAIDLTCHAIHGWSRDVAAKDSKSPEIQKPFEFLRDLLAHHSTWREYEHAFRSEKKGNGGDDRRLP
jgi:uncharacterized protein (DUF488 family)